MTAKWSDQPNPGRHNVRCFCLRIWDCKLCLNLQVDTNSPVEITEIWNRRDISKTFRKYKATYTNFLLCKILNFPLHTTSVIHSYFPKKFYRIWILPGLFFLATLCVHMEFHRDSPPTNGVWSVFQWKGLTVTLKWIIHLKLSCKKNKKKTQSWNCHGEFYPPIFYLSKNIKKKIYCIVQYLRCLLSVRPYSNLNRYCYRIYW